MNRSSRTVIRVALAACIACAAMAPASAFAITRSAVVTRARTWVVKNTAYSQSRYATVGGDLIPSTTSSPSRYGYRTDCSGFVSMSLGLVSSTTGAPLSLDTASLPYRCTELTGTVTQQKAQLKPGDLIIKPKTSTYGGHAIVFVRWLDTGRTKFLGYHERGTAYGTVANEIPYPYWNNDTRFRPFRYKSIEDERLRRSLLWPPVVKPAGTVSTSALPSVGVPAVGATVGFPATTTP